MKWVLKCRLLRRDPVWTAMNVMMLKNTNWIEARAYLEYGGNREDYWNFEKFMNQIKMAIMLAIYVLWD